MLQLHTFNLFALKDIISYHVFIEYYSDHGGCQELSIQVTSIYVRLDSLFCIFFYLFRSASFNSRFFVYFTLLAVSQSILTAAFPFFAFTVFLFLLFYWMSSMISSVARFNSIMIIVSFMSKSCNIIER